MQEKIFLTFLFLCVLKGKFVSSIECPSYGISMSYEDDNNFSAKYVNVDTYDLCGIFCARSDTCEYWTWYKENSRSNKYDDFDCLLFTSDKQLTSNDGAISGEKMCPSTIEPEPDCGNCSPQPIRFAAKNLTKITFDDGQDANYLDKIEGVGDSSLCGKLCAITTPCIYWTWYKATDGKRHANSCLMFDNIIQLQYNENAISGEMNYPDTDPEDRCPLVEDECNDPCVVDPEPGPYNEANVLHFAGAMNALGMAFYVAVMSAIRM